MFTEIVKEYCIDLGLPIEERWKLVVEKEKGVIDELVNETKALLELLYGNISVPLKLAAAITSPMVGEYREEIGAMTKNKKSKTILQLANLSYDLSRVGHSTFGCTAGFFSSTNPIFIRTLDWPLRGIGPATRVFHFHKGDRSFVAIGIPGFVGVLSGMVPGEYSVCINWLPHSGLPTFSNRSPIMLIREVLEKMDTYDHAVTFLSTCAISSSASFSVCGRRKKDMCVIERTCGSAHIRHGDLTEANHFTFSKFHHHNKSIRENGDNESMSTFEDSVLRKEELAQEIDKLPKRSKISDVIGCLDAVTKEDTVQKIAFCPATSEYIVLKRTR